MTSRTFAAAFTTTLCLLPQLAAGAVSEVETQEALDEFLHTDAKHNHMVGFFHRTLHTGGEKILYDAFSRAAKADTVTYAISHSDDPNKRLPAERHYGTGPPAVIVVMPVGSDHYVHHKCNTRHDAEGATADAVMEAILDCSREGPNRWQEFHDRPPLHLMHDEL